VALTADIVPHQLLLNFHWQRSDGLPIEAIVVPSPLELFAALTALLQKEEWLTFVL
jgi:hypothetical protein